MKKKLILVLLLSGIAACSVSNQKMVNHSPTAGVDGVDGEHIVNTIDVTGYGKPGAPVRLRYQLNKSIELGMETEITLDLTSDTSEGSMSVQLASNEGLSIQSSAMASFTLEPGAEYEVKAKVIPQEPTVPTVTIKEMGNVTRILWAITTLVSLIALWLIIG